MSLPRGYLVNTSNVSKVLDLLRSVDPPAPPTPVLSPWLKKIGEEHGIAIDKTYINILKGLDIIRPNSTIGEGYKKFQDPENGKRFLLDKIKEKYAELFQMCPQILVLMPEDSERVFQELFPGSTVRVAQQRRKTLLRLCEYVGIENFEEYSEQNQEVDSFYSTGFSNRRTQGTENNTTVFDKVPAFIKNVQDKMGVKLENCSQLIQWTELLLETFNLECKEVENDPSKPVPDILINEGQACIKWFWMGKDLTLENMALKLAGTLFFLMEYKEVYLYIYDPDKIIAEPERVVRQYEGMAEKNKKVRVIIF